ncbi:MAG TPA: hypothetical protein ENO08_01425 [Candidatus Eisenbacteria bacterium]|uniref:Peptidase MA-like domain-containing protein n=1 Tax=Eiseniibacteriota bacterium TaxID=2212470 RepID=A0A7V2ATS1_UNCEI|nr:hypothetical protein [Candidatus Eisenbacteria bacterium]
MTAFVLPVVFLFASARGGERVETKEVEGAPFIIVFPLHLEAMAERTARIIVRSYTEISGDIGLEGLDTVTVYIAGDRETYRRYHGDLAPEWGVAYSRWHGREIGIDAGAVLSQPRPLETVLRHELSHIALAERTGGVPCPRWFVEGLAMLQSKEWTFEDHWGLVRSIRAKSLPALDDLSGPFPRNAADATLAYRVSYYAVEELLRDRRGDLVTLTAFIRDLESFDESFALTFGESPGEYSARLHVLMLDRYETAALLIGSLPYWGAITLLFVAAYAVKRIRTGKRAREWERADKAAGERF